MFGWSRRGRIFWRREKWPFFVVLPATREDVQIPAIGQFFRAEKAEYLCGRLTATVGYSRTQSDIDESGTLVQRETIDGPPQKPAVAKRRPEDFF